MIVNDTLSGVYSTEMRLLFNLINVYTTTNKTQMVLSHATAS